VTERELRYKIAQGESAMAKQRAVFAVWWTRLIRAFHRVQQAKRREGAAERRVKKLQQQLAELRADRRRRTEPDCIGEVHGPE
jgi:hypothetical protein